MILLDTHIWLWWLLGEPNLPTTERKKIDKVAARGGIYISWATIWEVEMLERKKRIQLKPDLKIWLDAALNPDICTVLPVDTEVVLSQRDLPDFFHPDPADRLIAATASLANMPLATHDKKIRESGACRIWNP